MNDRNRQKTKSSKGGSGLAWVAGAAILLAGGVALYARNALTGGATEPTIDPIDGPKPEPPKPWSKGPGGKGKVFGGGKVTPGAGGPPLPEDLPADFDYAGNGIFVDLNCEYVIEGNLFWPSGGGTIFAEPGETLEINTKLQGGKNSVIGYIDHLVNVEGFSGDDPEGIAWTVLEAASPMCVSVDPSQWGAGLINWYENFLSRVIDYLEFGIGSDDQEWVVS